MVLLEDAEGPTAAAGRSCCAAPPPRPRPTKATGVIEPMNVQSSTVMSLAS